MDIQAIEQAAHAYAKQRAEQANSNTEFTTEELAEAFTAGAQWADNHPAITNADTESYIQQATDIWLDLFKEKSCLSEPDLDTLKECITNIIRTSIEYAHTNISADTFRQCIAYLNDTCYEDGEGVEESEINYVIRRKHLL